MAEKKSNSEETSLDTTTPARQRKDFQAAKAERSTAKEQEQGFRGVEVDPTPNENYTVAGVTSGKPTPETDVKAAEKAREATGLGLSALEAEAINKKQQGGGK